jgi:opacity protein-like surface antigen
VNPTSDRHLIAFNTIQTGWYAGGGFQFALNDAISLGLEYRHTDLGETVYHVPRSTKGPVFPGGTAVDVENDEVLFKVTILLGHLGEKKVVQTPMGKK